MNERKVLLFKKVCYDVGTRFSFVVNNKIIETVISDVMIDYHKNINYEKQSVRYHLMKTKIAIEPDCYYEQALNEKNFRKRLKRIGLI